MQYEGKMRYAHRISAHLFKGLNLDSDIVIMHTCDVRDCVNPDHLKFGTIAENNHDMHLKGRGRGRYSDVTHCSIGHRLEGDNLYIRPNGNKACKTCRRFANYKHNPKMYSTSIHTQAIKAIDWFEWDGKI